MRVLLTTDTIGGVWTFTKELTDGLLAFGHQVALVSLGRMPSESQQAWCDTNQAEFGASFRYKALDVPLEWMESNHASYSEAAPALMKLVREFKPDLIHGNQFCFGALPVELPKILTAHSDVLSWAEVCRPGGLEESPWLHRYRQLVEAGINASTIIVAPTVWMGQALQRGFPEIASVRVIPNGRTLEPVEPWSERRLQAVSVGRRWDEAKNMPILDGLSDVMPVFIAGETMLGEADALCEEEVMNLFRQSSVYVATSIYEPFGLAPLEAALCGCAVIANDIPSLREVWGPAAIYFRDAATLRAEMKRLADSPKALKHAQARSGLRAEQLSAVKMVDRYLDLYTELLEVRIDASVVMVEAYAAQL